VATVAHVARVAPLGKCGKQQTRHGQFLRGGKVLGRVDGGVSIAPYDRSLDLLDEHPLATQLRQRQIGPTVPFRVDDHQLGRDAGSHQQIGDPSSLPQGQG
jgi:hypothetical protein